MPITTTTAQPTLTALRPQEREVLYAVGCGLRDDEIAAALAVPRDVVAGHLARILAKLGLPDRSAAIVHAFDSGLVAPGRGPRRRATGQATGQATSPAPSAAARRTPGPRLQISLLGPLRAWHDGRPLDLGHLRQQAVLTALALCPGRTVSQQELLDGVWGETPPSTKVVPVYIYRLRKILRVGDSPHEAIERDRSGYRLLPGAVTVDVARMEELLTAAGAAERAGEPAEAVRLCSRALDLFRGEPLAGQPGPFAELERLRLTERRIAMVQRKLGWQLQQGQHAEAIAELSALTEAQPLNEPVAAMLMHALYLSGRQADALSVFDRTRRRLADDLGVYPGQVLQRAHRMILRGDESSLGPR
ncbi:BTAD domain-containing putative transcriptional regulator [Kitasatospora aureofaciens]|uniref:BTAD domain-containing putative transcriptional regulator n=1 Tax=Kitasatospora aureofaciens TaxID=1894 RepID=UPI001C45223D|nr:BTAD domain-containing putative transcriptional regulator [Kitasatospora aureofaciens]MBV6700362.1 winged helix-turn-helix domain-containing protein [Kitasatospora aureofaciens]